MWAEWIIYFSLAVYALILGLIALPFWGIASLVQKKAKTPFDWTSFFGVILGVVWLLSSLGNKYIAYDLLKPLEWRHPPLQTDVKGDVIVIFRNDERNVDRLLYVNDLFQNNTAPVILVSGIETGNSSRKNADTTNKVVLALESFGIPRESIITSNHGNNVRVNAKFSCQVIKDRGYKNVILVTSAMHMPRSVRLFKNKGCNVIPAPTSYIITEDAWNKMWYQGTFKTFIHNSIPSFQHTKIIFNSLWEFPGTIFWFLPNIQDWFVVVH